MFDCISIDLCKTFLEMLVTFSDELFRIFRAHSTTINSAIQSGHDALNRVDDIVDRVRIDKDKE